MILVHASRSVSKAAVSERRSLDTLADALSSYDRQLLRFWMEADAVNTERLRAGLPDSWLIADKTGTGDDDVANDAGRRRPARCRRVMPTARLEIAVTRRWFAISYLALAAAAPVALCLALTGCGASAPPKPGPTLESYLSAWGKGDWAAMRRQAAAPPRDFTRVNRGVFASLGVTSARFTAGPVQPLNPKHDG